MKNTAAFAPPFKAQFRSHQQQLGHGGMTGPAAFPLLPKRISSCRPSYEVFDLNLFFAAVP
jgi:hypothetical protein